MTEEKEKKSRTIAPLLSSLEHTLSALLDNLILRVNYAVQTSRNIVGDTSLDDEIIAVRDEVCREVLSPLLGSAPASDVFTFPLDYLTKVMGFSIEEAEAIIKAAQDKYGPADPHGKKPLPPNDGIEVSHKGYVAYSEQYGVFLRFTGRKAIWSKNEGPLPQAAMVFKSVDQLEKILSRSGVSGTGDDAYAAVSVYASQKDIASKAECVNAGLPTWN